MGIGERLLGVDDASFLRSVDVQLVFLISMVSSLNAVVSPALPAMSSTLGVPQARIGLVFTAFALPAIVALPLVGVVADLYGRKAVVAPGLLLFGIAGTGIGLAGEFRLILVLRGLQGVGYTAFNSLAVALLGDFLSGAQESAAQGSRVILNNLTNFIAPTVAGVLAAIAWYYPFYIYVIAIPASVLVYFRLGTDGDGTDGTDDTAGFPDDRDDRDDDRGMRGYAADVRAMVADPFVAGILAGGFFRMFLKYALYTFLALAIVTQYGGSLGYAGFVVGLYSLVGVGVASQSARMTEGVGHSYALVAGFLIAGVAYLAFPLAGGMAAVTALVILHGVGEGVINPIHKSLLTQSVDRGVRGGLVTTNAVVQNTAKTVTPVALSTVLVAFGTGAYDTLFFLTGAVTLVATGVAVIALALGGASAARNRLRDAGRGEEGN